jgi:putative lipoic acid-binding regulatory protein
MKQTMTTESDTLLTFPCNFPIKIFGLASAEYESAVMAILHSHIANIPHDAIQKRASRDNKYLAITAQIWVISKKQLDDIYQDLTTSPLIVMAL